VAGYPWALQVCADKYRHYQLRSLYTHTRCRFEKKHYLVLENALQNIATSKAAMFDGLLPALAEALERASTTTGPTTPRSAAPAALRETAAQLRVACLKLIKVTAYYCLYMHVSV
jgi:hypothetical protein